MDSIKTQRPRRVRTPTVLQMEAVECGAAALGIVLGYYGRVVPLAELRHECGVSRDGSTAANVIEAARHYGLQAAGFSMEVATLQARRGPAIVFWNFNHFVVVEGFRRQRVYLNDPASGPRTVSLEEFLQAFTGVVLVMEPGPDFAPGGQQPGTIHALRTRLQGSGGALAYAVMAGCLLVFPGLVRAVLTQIFIDQVLIEGLQDWVRPLLLGLLLTAAFHAGLLRLQLQALRRLHLKLATLLSGQFLWHLLHLPSSFYAQRYAGEISQRVQLNERIAGTLSGRLATTVIDVLMMLVYASVMLQYDVLLTLLGAGCALVNGLALRWLARWRMDANMRSLQEVGKLNGVAMAGLRGIETLKATALESDFFARWAGYYAKAANVQQALQMTNQTLGVLPPLLSALATMLVLVIGGLRVIDGHLSLGMLVALQSLMHSFLAPVNSLVGFGSTLQDLQGTLQRLDDVLHNPAPAARVSLPASRSVPPVAYLFQGTVQVRNVTFGYSRVHPPLLENVSFTLRPGQRVALVGASGSGKSTLARLVCGLYEPWQGDIRFDGIPQSQIPRQFLSHALALVDQDIVLFAGTVRENLTLWDATVPSGQLIRACKDALIHDVVLTLPGGYDGALLEGAANFSGGQRQRLEIARALVQDPTLLVMDEATSALDAETEYSLMQRLRKRSCTCLFVAHRLSTIRDCDAIIVLDHGKVVQQGTHAALLREGGVYTRLLAEAGEDSRVKPYRGQPGPALAPVSTKHGSETRGKARQSHAPQWHAAALAAHAAGLDPQGSSPSVTEEPLLLAAARAVGEMLGVPIRSPAPSEGSRPLNDLLESIARASHLRLRRVALTDHWWQRDGGPLIASIREDHRPVALLPVSATRYTLFDPLHRTRIPVYSHLAATLATEAHALARPFPNRALRWGDLLAFGLRGCHKDLRLVLLSGIAVTLLGMLMPQATALFIDHAIPDADRGMVLQLAAALLAAACGQALFHLAQGVALLRQSTTASATIQAALWDRLLALPAAFFRQYATGDLQTRVMAMSTMQPHLSGATLRTLCTSGLALLNLGLMLYYSMPLALLASAVALVTCLATGIAGALSIRQVRRLQHLTGTLLGMTAQLITGVAKLQAAGAQERAFAAWRQTFSQKQRVRQRLQGITDMMTVVNAVLSTLASVALFWGALRLFHSSGGSALSAGTFVAFHAAFGLFIAGATNLSNTWLDLLEVTTLWERVRPIVVTPPEVNTGKIDPGRLRGKIALEDVTFRYQEHSPVILDKVSLHAEPGEFIALVGPSGSGKSTLFRLLLGFETPQAGTVSYDDQELSRLDVVAVRRQLGAVLQHSMIMAATIFENIAGGALISQQEAWEAVHAAGLAEDIAAMPMGLHTFVSEAGSNLSGGQRQRLLIAHALVRQPALVLFDEATSALDNRTQAAVTASLERLRVTRVVIAHRLSTIRHADRIYVLVGGQVVQQGTFADLAQRVGPFAQLMARQGEPTGLRGRFVHKGG